MRDFAFIMALGIHFPNFFHAQAKFGHIAARCQIVFFNQLL